MYDAMLSRCSKYGIVLHVGAFSFGIKIARSDIAEEFLLLYQGFPFDDVPNLPDFRIELRSLNQLSRRLRRQIQTYIDGQPALQPMSPHLGIPLVESAMNWCLGRRVTRHLLIHAAVLERDGRALVMPGPSGVGKSTLTTALMSRGWRLLSDEVAIIDPRDGQLQPHPRPISLKNETIDLIASRYPDLTLTRRYEGTAKGQVAYVKPPVHAILHADRPARPSLVVAPRYDAARALACDRVEKADSFMLMVRQSPNYDVLLERGFETLADFTEACCHFSLRYSNLDAAVRAIDELSQASSEDPKAA